ncbi:MAG: prepilin-type N-terminal cleavage/methylation domain-containing protein [Azoarcus sp.]|nr:prepilin-type N-terminal cleavage/methylation domain-containing protein [Azoarcus sp.]
MKNIARGRGFSLIELALVLAILGLLSSALVAPLAARIEASQRREADAMLDDIANALVGFALLHRRLPCPSAGEGLEQPPPCAFAADNLLPWRTLGLPQSDPWGTPWRYRPDGNFSAATITLTTEPGSAIKVADHAGTLLTTSHSRVVAIIYSFGPNRHADGGNASAAASAPTFEGGEPAATFDDRLRWLGHYTLVARLAQSGRL